MGFISWVKENTGVLTVLLIGVILLLFSGLAFADIVGGGLGAGFGLLIPGMILFGVGISGLSASSSD